VTLRFFLLAALMTVAALALVVVPLLRRRGTTAGPDMRALRALDQAHAAGVISAEEYAAKRAALPEVATAAGAPNRPAFVTVLLVALLLPLSAIVLYRTIGTPEALDPAALTVAAPGGEHGISMDQAVAGLVAKLEQNPDDATGWALLGRAYQAMQRFAESRDALERARRLQPDDRDLQVEYAQALALASPEQRIDGESRRLLDEVVAADPNHQRALWLIGISEYQAQRYAEAIAIWERVLPQLPAGSNVARSIQDRIAEARRLGNLPAPPGGEPAAGANAGSSAAADRAAPTDATTAPAAAGPRLTVEVSLDPALADRLAPDATLFVFARAAEGPPMPLAIQRLSAGQLPLTVTLDESNGMLPNMKLSMFPSIVVGARVSRSGQAIAQSGDLQTLSAPLEVTRTAPIVLKIDQVVP
jgi:cytochrome c-type biogenesis protein CcmH